MRPPSGARQTRDGTDHLVLRRDLAAPVEDVWAAVTEPGRLERWIGTWTGDPSAGHVLFRMTAEGADAPEELATIRRCDPPHLLSLRLATQGQTWDVDLRLSHRDGVTTLEFAQACPTGEGVETMGPGWEYYLDRLVAAERGEDLEAIDFERDYYPAMAAHYRREFGAPPD